MEDKHKLLIISIIAAIILWIYVIATVNPTVKREFKNIPISYKNMDSLSKNGLDIVGDKETSVNVVLEGNSNDFINVKDSDIRAEVDLNDFDENSESIPISFYYPNRLRKVDSSIDELSIRIEKVISKEIKVEIIQESTPADDLAVLVGSIIPETVVVEGASSLVDRAEKAVAYQDMTEINLNTTRNAPIKVVDNQEEEIVGLKLSQNFVNVSYEVFKIENIPIELVTENDYPKDKMVDSVELSQEEVAIMLPTNILKGPENLKTKPFDLSQVKESGSYDLELVVPDGIKLREKNFKLSLNVVLVDTVSKIIEKDSKDIAVRNADKFKAEINPDMKIQVKVLAGEDRVKEIQPEDIKLFVDANGHGKGEAKLDLQADEVDGVKLDTISPPRIDVNLRDDG